MIQGDQKGMGRKQTNTACYSAEKVHETIKAFFLNYLTKENLNTLF